MSHGEPRSAPIAPGFDFWHLPHAPFGNHRRQSAQLLCRSSSTRRYTHPQWLKILRELRAIAGFTGDWTMNAYGEKRREDPRDSRPQTGRLRACQRR